jgi:prepilin-type N-terminal cleavage/methylation domain-containing protein
MASDRKGHTVTASSHNRDSRREGFTLIEVLMVIGILGLLLAIILPSVQGSRRYAYELQTEAQIEGFETALWQFHSETNHYPGQSRAEQDKINDDDWPATEVMARRLWTPRGENWDGANWEPEEAYAVYNEELVVAAGGFNYCPSDNFGNKPMPLLYYPSVPGTTPADDDHYRWSNNQAISGPSEDDFRDLITDGGAYYVRDKYLLIGAGIDRKYFTDDDITNFNH